ARQYRTPAASWPFALQPIAFTMLLESSFAGAGRSNVASPEPAAEPGSDLVRDRARRLGPVLRGRLTRITGPEQHHFIAFGHGLAAEIHHEMVHAHRAGDPPAPPPRLHLGRPGRAARHPLRVSHRNHPEGRGPAGDVAMAVRHPGARGYPF